MGSRQLGDRQMNFLARLYERGTGDSIPVTVSFQDNMIIIYLEENGNDPIAVPLDEWEVRVGGSAEDKIVLQAHQTGDTLVCGDELFLTAIAEATDNQAILKQVAKAKKRNSTRFVRQSTGIIALLIGLIMFGGCVTLAGLEAIKHPRTSRHTQDRRVEQSDEEPEQTADETSEEATNQAAEPEPFDGSRYMASIQHKIRSAWKPPSGLKPMKVVVHFSVDKSGKTSNARIAKSSGNKACDDSALKAISAVSPLPKLGAGSPPTVDIEYRFDYVGKKASAPTPAGGKDQGEMHRYD